MQENNTQENQEPVQENKQPEVIKVEEKPEAPVQEVKPHIEVPVQIGRTKTTVILKKKRDFADIENAKQIAAVKLWSTRLLKDQVTSTKISEEMKQAIEAELKNRLK